MSLENPTQEELEISWLSDVHKEAYGFRPRGDFWAKWDSASQLSGILVMQVICAFALVFPTTTNTRFG